MWHSEQGAHFNCIGIKPDVPHPFHNGSATLLGHAGEGWNGESENLHLHVYLYSHGASNRRLPGRLTERELELGAANLSCTDHSACCTTWSTTTLKNVAVVVAAGERW